MKCKLYSFDVGHGDCHVIRLIDDDMSYNIMVDCHKFNNQIANFLHETLHDRIDLLIVTHLDNDHIVGIKQMLEKNQELVIGKIIHNSLRFKAEEESTTLSPSEEKYYQQLKEILPREFDPIEYKETGFKDSLLLSKVIMENEHYKEKWETERKTIDSDAITLEKEGNNFGKIYFISPTSEALKNLDNAFKSHYDKMLMKQFKENLQNIENIYEVILTDLNIEKRSAWVKPVSKRLNSPTSNFIKKSISDTDTLPTVNNQSSVAFILKSEGHYIAMLGDSPASILEEGLKIIKEKYEELPDPINCDIMKISHHGSGNGTSINLLNKLTSDRFLISGGKEGENPDVSTIGRIAMYDNCETEKTIFFSHKNSMTRDLVNLPDNVKRELNLKLAFENEFDVFQ